MSVKSFNPYVTFDGNCAEALDFYAQCLGASLEAMHRYAGSPLEKDLPPDSKWGDKVMHASLVWHNFRLMASDRPPQQPHAGFHGISLSISVDDTAEAERIFAALSQGGQTTMPIAQTFWARRFGMLVDRFGLTWMVNCE